MESKEGRSQELSKARTRLTLPRGRVVQPPLPAWNKAGSTSAPQRGEGPPLCQGTPECQAPGKGWQLRKWLFTLTLPPRSRSTPHL